MAKYCATPGMTSILHTFGSDMKYHIHVHALVTFGGLAKHPAEMYPPTNGGFRN
ncbi:MAG: transposase [Saprospiraceae bacterium]|nr:transposase [Saprospiraceae bacterium]